MADGWKDGKEEGNLSLLPSHVIKCNNLVIIIKEHAFKLEGLHWARVTSCLSTVDEMQEAMITKYRLQFQSLRGEREGETLTRL